MEEFSPEDLFDEDDGGEAGSNQPVPSHLRTRKSGREPETKLKAESLDEWSSG